MNAAGTILNDIVETLIIEEGDDQPRCIGAWRGPGTSASIEFEFEGAWYKLEMTELSPRE